MSFPYTGDVNNPWWFQQKRPEWIREVDARGEGGREWRDRRGDEMILPETN